MRIVVNDIAASTGGALTVLRDFYNCVKENDKENEWIFLLGDNILEETENIKIITLPEIKHSHKKKMLFDFFTGKKFINSLKPDVFFSLQNIITFGLKMPKVVYIHQSIPFQTQKKFSFFKRNERKLAVYQYLIGFIIKLSAKKADKVIVQTNWMKKAVCKQCGLSDKRVLKISPIVNSLDLNNEDSFDQNYFFYPTSPAVYKNNDLIFNACEILDNKKLNYEVALTINNNQYNEKIKCVGRLPYKEVIKNYAKSTLIFPSYIETFGYPIAEARMVGTVILASDCPFSHEILENYENAYFFDPFEPKELAELMEKVITGKITKNDVLNPVIDVEDSWLEVIRAITEV